MPVLIVCTSDVDRHFNPFGISVCSNEKEGGFKFIFRSLVDSLKKLDEQIHPNTLISNASNSIQNAFTIEFGNDGLLIMCWAHMMLKNLNIVAEEFRNDIMDDIDTLQLCPSKDVIDKAMPLFIKKWRQKNKMNLLNT